MTVKEMLILFKPGSGCDYHRMALPYGYMGYDFSNGLNLTPEKVAGFKCIAFNRVPLNIDPDTIKRYKDNGGLVLMDVDDYWILPSNHYLKSGWAKAGVSERIMKLLEIATVVTCTTERLASKVKEFNENALVIPNSLPFINHSQFTYTRQPSEHVRFGFVGGSSHLFDVRQIGPIFQHYSQLPFKFCGYSEKNDQAKKMDLVFSNYGKNKNYTHLEMQPLDKYLYGYDDIDVAIAPLEDNEFNKYKSNLKILEAGLKKCAIICSPNACYTDTVPDNIVTYAKSIRDWKEAFKQYKDKDFAKERGEKVYEWVKQYYEMGEVNKLRSKLLESL